MKQLVLLLSLAVLFSTESMASECGGRGYTGTDNRFCLKCHSGCPVIHPTDGIPASETACVKIPYGFPVVNGKLVCVSCHDMSSRNKYFLRTTKPIKTKMDFCFECHDPECYRKFNPHKVMVSKLPWKEKKRACVYCHGVGAELEAYNSCVGCHTLTPHPGAIEHLKAPRKVVRRLIENNKEVVDITSIKQLSPKLDESVLEFRQPKIIVVNGRVECITCHNPHPQMAIPAAVKDKEILKLEKADFEYQIRKLRNKLKRFRVVSKVDLMSGSMEGGKLCTACHNINSLK